MEEKVKKEKKVKKKEVEKVEVNDQGEMKVEVGDEV